MEQSKTLDASDIEYIADMLRAIIWISDDVETMPREYLESLCVSLSTSEKLLRDWADKLRT